MVNVMVGTMIIVVFVGICIAGNDNYYDGCVIIAVVSGGGDGGCYIVIGLFRVHALREEEKDKERKYE